MAATSGHGARPPQRQWRTQFPFTTRHRAMSRNVYSKCPTNRKAAFGSRPTMKKRQARKILNQVLQQGRPVNLPDGRRASKRAIRRARSLNSDLLADLTLQELKRVAALARRFDSAKKTTGTELQPEFQTRHPQPRS